MILNNFKRINMNMDFLDDKNDNLDDDFLNDNDNDEIIDVEDNESSSTEEKIKKIKKEVKKHKKIIIIGSSVLVLFASSLIFKDSIINLVNDNDDDLIIPKYIEPKIKEQIEIKEKPILKKIKKPVKKIKNNLIKEKNLVKENKITIKNKKTIKNTEEKTISTKINKTILKNIESSFTSNINNKKDIYSLTNESIIESNEYDDVLKAKIKNMNNLIKYYKKKEEFDNIVKIYKRKNMPTKEELLSNMIDNKISMNNNKLNNKIYELNNKIKNIKLTNNNPTINYIEERNSIDEKKFIKEYNYLTKNFIKLDIMIKNKIKYAILKTLEGDLRIKEGQTLKGFKIEEIKENQLKLSKDDNFRIFNFFEKAEGKYFINQIDVAGQSQQSDNSTIELENFNNQIKNDFKLNNNKELDNDDQFDKTIESFLD
jgi:hypothetical protein